MSDWYEGIKSKEKEATGSVPGTIKESILSPEELEDIRKKYPNPTGEAAKRPFIIKGQY